jgi:hypothetical protein
LRVLCQGKSGELAKKWKLRGEQGRIKKNQLMSSSTVIATDMPMDTNQQPCPSSSMQTSGIDDSERQDFRKNRRTPQRAVRPGVGGFHPDSPVIYCGRGFVQTGNPSRVPTGRHNFPSYSWGHIVPPGNGSGSRGGHEYGGGSVHFQGPSSQPFKDSYRPHSWYDSYGQCPVYDASAYETETEQMWEEVPNSDYNP